MVLYVSVSNVGPFHSFSIDQMTCLSLTYSLLSRVSCVSQTAPEKVIQWVNLMSFSIIMWKHFVKRSWYNGKYVKFLRKSFLCLVSLKCCLVEEDKWSPTKLTMETIEVERERTIREDESLFLPRNINSFYSRNFLKWFLLNKIPKAGNVTDKS